ncbi:SDR family oxidoreductase [Micromonospora sp. NPDC050980]|uniref:SDR family oxidoreductase n=1 Tax=Micromonospora sp. NPDC050980 TaxID=3155161 RepID=UPI0033D87EE2
MRTNPVNPVVAVTGGARGIGAATVARLRATGWRVAAGDLTGGDYELDVTDPDSFRAFLDNVERDLGPVDVLVNNAGVMWVGPFADEPAAATDAQLAVNVRGVINGFRLSAPRMRARGHGHLVTIASSASRVPAPGAATYAATKHAVLGYAMVAREELRGTGVEVSLVLPAVVDTELARGTDHGAVARLRPDEVAEAVLRVLRRPRFETYVPARLGLFARLVAGLPAPAGQWLWRHSVPNQLTAGNPAERVEYERRLTG